MSEHFPSPSFTESFHCSCHESHWAPLTFFPLFTAAVAHLERTVSQLLWRFSWTWKRVDLSILRVLFRMLPSLPPGHRLVSVNMVCSFLTVLKPLIVSTNSSSSINCRRRMEIIEGNSHISSDMFFLIKQVCLSCDCLNTYSSVDKCKKCAEWEGHRLAAYSVLHSSAVTVAKGL